MIKDDILDYWIESVSAALDEIDGISPFTDQNIKDLAENMMISAEQEGMAFGYDAIPNPQQTMIEHLKEYESNTYVGQGPATHLAKEAAIEYADVALRELREDANSKKTSKQSRFYLKKIQDRHT